MTMTDPLKLENQLCHRFYLLSNAFTRAYRPLLASLGITYPQYIVMMALWEEDNITIHDLVAKTGIDAGAMSLMLRKLVEKGYLVLNADEQDRRAKRVALTVEGKQAREAALAVPEGMLCRLDGMTREEGKQLMRLMDKLKGCFAE